MDGLAGGFARSKVSWKDGLTASVDWVGCQDGKVYVPAPPPSAALGLLR